MKSLLQRLLSSLLGSKPTPTAPPVPSPGREAEARAQHDAPALSAVQSLGARRPLIASDGHIAGFEFQVGEQVLQRLLARSDDQGKAAYACSVLASARLIGQSGRIGFARIALDWLLLAADAQAGPGTMVALEHDGANTLTQTALRDTEQLTRRLQRDGAKVGWSPDLEMAIRPDFLLLRQGSLPMADLLAMLRARGGQSAALPVLATDIANLADLETALQNGVRYACGSAAPARKVQDASKDLPVPPEVRRIGQLLHQLVTGAETAEIVAQIKGDVGLSYRLLRRINSASFAQLSSGATIEQAAMILGRNELYRWFSMLLIQFSGQRKASSALQEIALWRARLMELLALHQGDAQAGQMFTLGLASMLGLLLKASPTEVSAALNLPPAACQALLQQAGPWYPYLKLVVDLERHALPEAEPALERFGGHAHVLELSDQAWAWAAQNTYRDASAAGG